MIRIKLPDANRPLAQFPEAGTSMMAKLALP